MDSIFGIGGPELILILLLAGIVMGPQKIRQVALWLGRTTAKLQSISRSFARQLNAELDAVDDSGNIRNTMNEMNDLRRQISDLRKEIATAAISPIKEGQEMLKESQKLVNQSIAPPSLLVSKNDYTKPDSIPSKPANIKDTTSSDLPNIIEVPDDPES